MNKTFYILVVLCAAAFGEEIAICAASDESRPGYVEVMLPNGSNCFVDKSDIISTALIISKDETRRQIVLLLRISEEGQGKISSSIQGGGGRGKFGIIMNESVVSCVLMRDVHERMTLVIGKGDTPP